MDRATSPFFIVCGILLESRRELRRLDRRFRFIARDILGKPEDFEFKSTRLNRRNYVRVLKELAPVDFQWAAACFVKENLTGRGFSDPTTFYRYTYQFLVGDLLCVTWASELYFDEYSQIGSAFEATFKDYLREQNAGLPPDRIRSITMLESHRERLLQFADLLGGVVKNRLDGSFDLLDLVDEKLIDLRIWPPP